MTATDKLGPLEKAARAAYEHARSRATHWPTWASTPEEARSEWKAIARAVLLAVREPDYDLSCVGAAGADDGGDYDQASPFQCADAFAAMIDAILEGK